jgi:hypothetical protein
LLSTTVFTEENMTASRPSPAIQRRESVTHGLKIKRESALGRLDEHRGACAVCSGHSMDHIRIRPDCQQGQELAAALYLADQRVLRAV